MSSRQTLGLILVHFFSGLGKAANEDPLGQLNPLNNFGWSHGYFRRPERNLSVIRLKRKNNPDASESEYLWTPAQWFTEYHRSLKRGIPSMNYGNLPKSTVDEIKMIKKGFPPFGARRDIVPSETKKMIEPQYVPKWRGLFAPSPMFG